MFGSHKYKTAKRYSVSSSKQYGNHIHRTNDQHKKYRSYRRSNKK